MQRRGEDGGRRVVDLICEVLVISLGVFLGLWATNWHEAREHRADARAALHNFAEEMELNLQSIDQKHPYHETVLEQINRFLASEQPATAARFRAEVPFRGVKPVIFEHTAWDLALATQSLSYLEPKLAFDISKVYTKQNAFQNLENSFLAAAYTPASFASDNMKGMAVAMQTYFNDINLLEPAMITLYQKTIPEIKSALRNKPSR